ncbi:MAG: hypothetical protein U0R44_06050 [Candidatus Micrarchaeia archaeon]
MGGKSKEQKHPGKAMPLHALVYMSVKAAIGLYDRKRGEEELKSVMPLSDGPLACYIFLLAGIVTALIAIATSLESYYLTNFASDTLSEATGIAQARIPFESLLPIAAFDLILYVLIGVIIAIASEGVAFLIIKMSGGEGRFADQFYLSSVIGLSVSIASGLSLLFPLNVFFSLLCIQIVVGLATIAIVIYLAVLVNARAYRIVHGISMLHAISVILLVGVPRLALTIFMMNLLAPALGLPVPISVPGV